MSPKSLALCEKKVLIVGDLMLDEYWIGSTNKISQEAPVPIVLVQSKDYRAGGAANVALNIAGLGSSVDLVGIISSDNTGDKLQNLLNVCPKIKKIFHK